MAKLRFEGFSPATDRFFRALAKHQDRAWFNEHKADHEAQAVVPMRLLLEELRAALDASYPTLELHQPKIFRIQRDVRFSKDKSPYKTHIAGMIAIAGRGDAEGVVDAPVALYVSVGGADEMAAAGQYGMGPRALERWRTALLDEDRGGGFMKELGKLERDGFRRVALEALKRPPRGVDPEHPRVELLKQKGCAVAFPERPKALHHSREFFSWLRDHARRVAPLVTWLAHEVG